jgi:GNAT superfamily N-acetyltransferase
LRVRRAAPEEAERWAATAGHGFFERPDLPQAEVEVGITIFHMPSAECYLAEEDGQPAATAVLAVRDGLALLFADSTVPYYRRRGLHTSLIRARLRDAAARGCTLAAASAAPGSGSQANYERCGFHVAYTKAVLVG